MNASLTTSLSDLQTGRLALVADLDGLADSERDQLTSLGIAPGTRLRLAQRRPEMADEFTQEIWAMKRMHDRMHFES